MVTKTQCFRDASGTCAFGPRSQDEYDAAFAEAGLVLRYDGKGLSGRGLYVAWREVSPERFEAGPPTMA